MAVEKVFIELRKLKEESVDSNDFPEIVSKTKILDVLSILDRANDSMVDAVYALLDEMPSFFKKAAAKGKKFSDGATVAQIGSHIGILQRGKTKLDREGRDYWLKPLWELGVIEKVYFDSKNSVFIPGHPKAKSPNSAYRLSPEFKEILMLSDDEWKTSMLDWINEDNLRERLAFQAEQAENSKKLVSSSHTELIKGSASVYAERFLPGYEVIYIDDGDGDRITEEQRQKLFEAGLTFELNDAMPDVLLWNKKTDCLWVIEAVTSDGEVDNHKKAQMTEYCARHNKKSIGFTTTYPNWKKFSERQSVLKNIADGTYVWINDDASKNIYFSSNQIQD